MATPPGRPCFPHLHLKARLPASLAAEVVYELQLSATNEMDMWDSGDTEGWGATLPVIQLQVLHPHAHAVATPVAPAAAADASATPPTAAAALPPPSASALLPAPPSLTPAAAALRLHNVAVRLAPDCKPLLSRGGKGTLRFLLSPTPAMLARNLALYPPGAPLSHPFYLHVSVPGPLGTHILPALSGPHQLFQTGGKAAGGGGPGSAGTNASGTVSTEKLTYVMGEHGVHHAIFVPLDHTPVPATSGGAGARGKAGSPGPPVPASVYSFPTSSLGPHQSPPAFVRFKEILGVNLGGRIWDCGLLLFSYLRERVLAADPHYFHGRKVLEVGSGTGLVGIWLWAYVLLKNRQAVARAERLGQKRPVIPATEFLLTDQEEAMDNLRDNISTNLALLTGGASCMDGVRIEASQLSWGCDSDHAALSIQPTPRAFDLIIASDVVFNPIYFTPLLDSLAYISGPGTTVILAYRPRASDRKQDEVFFRALPRYGWSAKKEAKYQDVFMLTLTKDGGATAQAPSPSPSPPPATASTAPAPAPTPAAADAAPTPASTAQSETPAASAAAPSASASSSPVAAVEQPAATAAPTVQPATTAAPVVTGISATAPVAAPSFPLASASASASATPSSSTGPSDPLGAVLTLHSLDIAAGHSEGSADGIAKAIIDAREAGAGRGRDMAGELGFYAGFLHTCSLLHQSHPESFPDRIWTRVAKLRATMLKFPLYASGFDPHTLDDGVAFIAMRNAFKLLLSQMGFAQYFQHEAPNPQSISF